MRTFDTKIRTIGLLLLSLLVLVMPITAQQTVEPDTITNDPALLVTVVRAELSETDAGTLINVSYQVDDACNLPVTVETTTDSEQNTTFILLKRDRMGQDWECSTEVASLTNVDIQLNTTLEADSYVVLNDRLFRVVEEDDTLSIVEPTYTMLGVTDLMMIATRSMPPQFNLVVTAEYVEGCAVDFINHLWTDEDLGLINVALYYTMPDGVRCLPQMASTTVPFALGEREGAYEITVNGHVTTYDFDTMEMGEIQPPLMVETDTPDDPSIIVTPPQDTMKIDVAVENFGFEVLESAPPQLSLSVNGYTDGCEYPIEFDVTQDGTDINVRVYREMPVGIACPAIAKYFTENFNIGSFEMGHTYTITVNGISQTVTL